MKISMIEVVSSHGGANYYDYGLLNALGKLGNEVTLYTSCPLNFDISDNSHISVDLTYKGLFETKNKIVKLCKYIFGTINSLCKSKIRGAKIIHFQIFAITFLEVFVVWLSKVMRFKLIVTVHDVESFNGNNSVQLTKYFYNSVDKIIIHNKISYETIVSNIKDTNNAKKLIKKCCIIPHGSYIGMLPNKIEKKIAKQMFGLSPDIFVFLFFGQIKRVKGLDILLKAYGNLENSIKSKKVMLIIAGKVWKDDMDIYSKIIEENNLQKKIILDIKYIKDEDVVKYYSAADCIVLPYKKIFQSGVLLMAQSYKVPVIVSDLPGMTEIVEDEKNGFIFKTESVTSLANCLNRVIKKSDLEKVIETAYKKLELEYNWDCIAKRQLEIMSTML